MTYDQLSSSQSFTKEQGDKGEAFAFEYERKRLPSFLHDKIVHLGQYEVARGYDILSFESKDSILPDRYIEVKTYKGHPHFYWTDNEIAAARKYAEHYYLYLVDIDRVNEDGYEPQIIPNPATLFDKDQQWSITTQQYLFSLISNEQIPDDWDDSTILLGCYNNEEHLKWILDHNLYNVRAQKDSPGAVSISNPQVQKASYLILYSVANPRVYMLNALEAKPYKVTKTEMIALGYNNPHAFSYILHPIQKQLDTFHIDLATLLREVNHQGDNTYGTPLYLNGIQLRRFMVNDTKESMSKQQYPSTKTKVATSTQSKQGAPWSQDEDTHLLEQLNNNISISEISQNLNRTEKAIARRMDRLRSQRVIGYELYISYYDNDPAFASKKKYNESSRKKN